MKALPFVFLFLFSAHSSAELLYKNDEQGQPVSGEKDDLIEAMRSGYDISVQIDNDTAKSQTYRGDQIGIVTVDGIQDVCLMTKTFAPNIKAMDSYGYYENPYWVHYCSNGKNYVRRAGSSKKPPISNSYTMTWRKTVSSTQPKVLLENNAQGEEVLGSKKALREAVMAGNKVVVRFSYKGGEKIYRGAFSQIHGNEVCNMNFIYAYNISGVDHGSFDVRNAPFSKNMCTNGAEYVKHPDPKIKATTLPFSGTWIAID